VDNSNPKSCYYDLIIERDLMLEIGIDLCFSNTEIRWDNASIPMQSADKLDKHLVDNFEKELLFAHDPVTTDAERIQNIVENKYCPADLNTIVKNCKVLDNSEKSTLLKLLSEFKHYLMEH
jgi:glutamyl/glutaminyl-tRNA synthetase